MQLLRQSPSIEDLKALIRTNVQKYAAWDMLKEKATHKGVLLEMIEWCDLKDELDLHRMLTGSKITHLPV